MFGTHFGSHKAAGFTLIEVMIAVMVLSIGLLGAAAMQTRATQSNLFASQLTDRTSVAEQAMERLMSLDFDDADLDDVTPVDTAPLGTFTTGTFTRYIDPAPPAGYTVTWDIAADYPVNNMKTIRVTATPTNSNRPPVVFSFVRANRKGM